MTVLNFLLQPLLLPCLSMVAPVLLLNSTGGLVGTILLIDLQSHSNADQHKMSTRAPSCPLGVPLTSSTLWFQKAPDSTWIKNNFLKIPESSNSKTWTSSCWQLYIHTHTYIHTHIYTYMYMHIHMYVYICIYIYIIYIVLETIYTESTLY